MLLYVEIKMTIISWHTHTTPSHAVQEENGSPRNPCKLPVILPRISTREKVIERLLNVSVAVYETPWSGQSTAIPGFEMILYTVRGSASVHVSWLCSTALEREPHKEPELWTSAHKTPQRTSPNIPVSTPGKQSLTTTGTDPVLLLSDFHSMLTFTRSARNWASVYNVCSFHDSRCRLLERWFHQILLHGHVFPAHWKFKHSRMF